MKLITNFRVQQIISTRKELEDEINLLSGTKTGSGPNFEIHRWAYFTLLTELLTYKQLLDGKK